MILVEINAGNALVLAPVDGRLEHIRNLHLDELAVFLALVQGLTGLVGMDMDLNEVFVHLAGKLVTNGFQISLEA